MPELRRVARPGLTPIRGPEKLVSDISPMRVAMEGVSMVRAKEVLFVSWPIPRRGKSRSSCSSKERVELIGPELDARRRAAMTSWPRLGRQRQLASG